MVCKVIDAQGEAEIKYGARSGEACEAEDLSAAMCDEVNTLAWKLATVPPTMRGAFELARHLEIEQDGEEVAPDPAPWKPH